MAERRPADVKRAFISHSTPDDGYVAELEVLVTSLAADSSGLCIITSREHLKNVEALATATEEKLDKLPKEAAIALLRHLEIIEVQTRK